MFLILMFFIFEQNIVYTKLLTVHHLEFLSMKGGCTGSSESTLVKMPQCWKSHVMAQVGSFVGHKSIYVDDYTLYMGLNTRTCLQGFENNKGAEQPAHPRSLISAFVFRVLESIISFI